MIKDKNTTIGYHCPHCGAPILNYINVFSFSAAGNIIKLKCPCGASELTVNITRDKKFRLNVPCIVCPNSHSYTISSNIFFEREVFSFSCKFTALSICFIGKNGPVVTEALKKNERELLSTFAEYDDTFDPDMAELSDIFSWDGDDGWEDNNGEDDEGGWFEALFSNYLEGEDEYDDETEDDFDALMELFTRNTAKPKTGFEIYINENFTPDAEQESGKKEREGDINAIDTSKIKNYQATSQILSTLAQLLRGAKIYCKCKNFDGSISLLENYVHIECKKCGSERDIKSFNISDIEYIAEMGELYLDFDD